MKNTISPRPLTAASGVVRYLCVLAGLVPESFSAASVALQAVGRTYSRAEDAENKGHRIHRLRQRLVEFPA